MWKQQCSIKHEGAYERYNVIEICIILDVWRENSCIAINYNNSELRKKEMMRENNKENWRMRIRK